MSPSDLKIHRVVISIYDDSKFSTGSNGEFVASGFCLSDTKYVGTKKVPEGKLKTLSPTLFATTQIQSTSMNSVKAWEG